MKKIDLKKQILNFAPLMGLLILFVVFIAIGTANDINLPYGMRTIVNPSVIVATVATGAIFIYTLGSFDISLGARFAVSALLGGMAYNATGNLFIMLMVNIGVAVLIALFNSVLASVFNLPVFVTTIAMLSVLNALVQVLIRINNTGSEIAVPRDAVEALNTPSMVPVWSR